MRKSILQWLLLCLITWGTNTTTYAQEQSLKISNRIAPHYHLLGHRGGVTEQAMHPENSLAALDEAVKRGYSGVEIDIRESKDGVPFLYHNSTFERDYDTKARCSDLTWEEIQQLQPLRKDGKAPVSFEHYCHYAQGKIQEIMLDIKLDHPSKTFYEKIENTLRETGFLEHSYSIGHGEHFLGTGCKITMLIREREEFFQKNGTRTHELYFLFAKIDELNSRLLRWCTEQGIQVIACVNRPWREPISEKNKEEVNRDLEWL